MQQYLESVSTGTLLTADKPALITVETAWWGIAVDRSRGKVIPGTIMALAGHDD